MGPKGLVRPFTNFGPNGAAPTISLKFGLGSLLDMLANLAEETLRANEHKGPFRPLQSQKSRDFSARTSFVLKVLANSTSLERP